MGLLGTAITVSASNPMIAILEAMLAERDKTIAAQNLEIAEQNTKIAEQRTEIARLNALLAAAGGEATEISERLSELEAAHAEAIAARQAEHEAAIAAQKNEYETEKTNLQNELEAIIAANEKEIERLETLLRAEYRKETSAASCAGFPREPFIAPQNEYLFHARDALGTSPKIRVLQDINGDLTPLAKCAAIYRLDRYMIDEDSRKLSLSEIGVWNELVDFEDGGSESDTARAFDKMFAEMVVTGKSCGELKKERWENGELS